MSTMPDHLRHAKHSRPHPDCAVCRAMADKRMAGAPVQNTDAYSVRAVGGYVQESARFVR